MKMSTILSTLFLSAALMMAAQSGHAAAWIIDPAKSKIGIIAKVNGITAAGHFEGYSAKINFDPEDLKSAQIIVEIDLAAAKMKDPQQTAALGGTDWFDITQFPKAKFTSTGIKATGDNTFEMAADLTLKGKTLPVTLPFTFTTTNNKAHAVGELMIMRNDFSVGQGQFSSGAIVALEVKVTLDISADMSNQ